MKPKVSILINNYNYSRYLAESIDSALAQSLDPGELEVVVVDDGSTDESLKILDAYQDRVKVVRQANQGQVGALNACVANAQGAILMFLDSDDRFFPEKVSALLRAGGSNLSSDRPVVIFDWYERIDADGNRTQIRGPKALFRKLKRLLAKPSSGMRKLTTPGKVLRSISALGYSPKPYFEGTSRITINRAAAEAAFPLEPSGIKICADALLVRVCSLYADFYEFNQALTDYRIHGSNNWWTTAPKAPVDVEGAVANNVNLHLARRGLACRWERTEACASLEFAESNGWKPFLRRLTRSGSMSLTKIEHALYIFRMVTMRKLIGRVDR